MHGAGGPLDAMGMIWANFTQEPSLNVYQDLNRYARKLKCWESWRKKALQHMRDTINDCKAEFERRHPADSAGNRAASLWWAPVRPDHSLLVAVLLWEGREEEAWMEAKHGPLRILLNKALSFLMAQHCMERDRHT